MVQQPLSEWDEDLVADSDEEFDALIRSLRWAEGFGLVFVCCAEGDELGLMGRVKAELPQKQVGVLSLDETAEDLYEEVAALADQRDLDILMVLGLKHSLYEYEDLKRVSGWSEAEVLQQSWKGVPTVLVNLNQQRERFRDDFDCFFVFLVPPFIIRYLIRRAPDFFDWRSGVFALQDKGSISIQEKIKETFEQDIKEVGSLSPSERIERILEFREALDNSELSDEGRFQLLSQLGILFLVETQPYDAEKCWRKAVTLDPHSSERLISKGHFLAAFRQYEEAIASYDKALEIKPDDNEAWYNRGISLGNLGRYEEAIASYDKALEIKPDQDEAWNNRGNALDNLGRYEEAIASYDKALEIKPDKDEAWYNRGISLHELGRYEDAIASYDKALEIKSDKDEAWYNRGNSLHELGRYEDAIASYDKALEIKSDKDEAWYNRGNSLGNLGRDEEAIASFDKALEIKPDKDEAIYNKACAYALMKRTDLALRYLEEAIILNPDHLREFAKTDSDFDSLRDNPQFQALLSSDSTN